MGKYSQRKRDISAQGWLWLADHRRIRPPEKDEGARHGLRGSYQGRGWKDMPGSSPDAQRINFFFYRRGLLVATTDDWVDIDKALELREGGHASYRIRQQINSQLCQLAWRRNR